MVKKKDNFSAKLKKHSLNLLKVIVIILFLILIAFLFNVIKLWILPIIVILFLIILSFYHFYTSERWEKSLFTKRKKGSYVKFKEQKRKRFLLKTLKIFIFITLIIGLVILYQYIEMWIVPIIAFLILLGVLHHHFYPKKRIIP